MPEERAFDLCDVLALTHRLPIELEPYLQILTYLNGRPASTADPLDAPAAWILERHPQLQELAEPDLPYIDCTDAQQLAAWEEWAEAAKSELGETLTLQPIPEDRRDQRTLPQLVPDRAEPGFGPGPAHENA